MKTCFATLLCLSMSVTAWAQAPRDSAASSQDGVAHGQVSASASSAGLLGPEGEDSGHGPGLSGADERAGRGIQIGAVVGFGWSFDDKVGSVNPLGLGLGVMGGAHLAALYLGVRAHFYLGGGSDLPTGRFDMSEWLVAAEAGYDVDLARVLVLRPGLLLGAAFFSQNGPPRSIPAGYIGGTRDQSYGRLYLAPGASLVLPLGRLSRDLSFLYAGLDLRLGLFLGNPTSGGLESSLVVGVEL